VAIYPSPSYKSTDRFLVSLDRVLTTLSSFKTVALININITPDDTGALSENYLELTSSHGLLPAHNFPTCLQRCLDHVILKTNRPADIFVLDCLITDHVPLVFCSHTALDTQNNSSSRLRIDYPAVAKELLTAL
jgi:hypothetical protein